ncbi:hypothetical protein JX266_001798 [Neoarthrinium moseri]|nr:hypothetical protein JX266_001798 [Neoarthrinium moseri]
MPDGESFVPLNPLPSHSGSSEDMHPAGGSRAALKRSGGEENPAAGAKRQRLDEDLKTEDQPATGVASMQRNDTEQLCDEARECLSQLSKQDMADILHGLVYTKNPVVLSALNSEVLKIKKAEESMTHSFNDIYEQTEKFLHELDAINFVRRQPQNQALQEQALQNLASWVFREGVKHWIDKRLRSYSSWGTLREASITRMKLFQMVCSDDKYLYKVIRDGDKVRDLDTDVFKVLEEQQLVGTEQLYGDKSWMQRLEALAERADEVHCFRNFRTMFATYDGARKKREEAQLRDRFKKMREQLDEASEGPEDKTVRNKKLAELAREWAEELENGV